MCFGPRFYTPITLQKMHSILKYISYIELEIKLYWIYWGSLCYPFIHNIIYNFIVCVWGRGGNQCWSWLTFVSSNPDECEAYFIQHYVIKCVCNLRQVGGFLRVVRFSPQIKLTAWYNWNIVERGVKHYNHNFLIFWYIALRRPM